MNFYLSQPSFWKREYILTKDDGSQIAGMKYSNSFFVKNNEAEVVSNNGAWIIKRKSFWSAEVLVIEKNTQVVVCTFKYNGWKKLMKCTIDLNSYHFKKAGFFRSVYSWENEAGENIMMYKPVSGLKLKLNIESNEKHNRDKNLFLLLFIGAYQINSIRAAAASSG